MRVFAVYPAFDPSMDEMAMVWRKLCEARRVELWVIALQASRLKAHVSASASEDHTNLRIRRFPSLCLSEEVRSFARQSDPDLIFCAVDLNLPLARQIARVLAKPVVLHTEYFLDDRMVVRRRRYLGLSVLRPIAAHLHRQHLAGHAVKVLSSDPADFRDAISAHRFRLAYLPWPHAGKVEAVPSSARDRDFSAYIGSLQRGKGAIPLHLYFSSLLAREPEFRLTLVGPPVDRAGRALVEGLQSRFPSQVKWLGRCSREEARSLIARSCFILSPGKRMGWGLIADAWSSGTPVISAAEHYDLRHDHNCLVAPTASSFLEQVDRLRSDGALWERLSGDGLKTSRAHSVESVAEVLWEQLKGSLGRSVSSRAS